MPRHASAATRRWQATLIIAVFIAAVAGAALGGWWYARESTPHQGPIVLICVDGLHPARLPVHGGSRTTTPSIDALAADGVVFERAYTHSPLTLPAHASLLAGQLPFEHGVRDEAGFALEENAHSLAELLRNRGFETGAAVSSFLLRPESGVAQGFSFFDAELPDQAGALSPVVERDGAQTTDAAARWLRSRRGHRFFLFVQVNESAAESTVTQLVSELEDRGLYDQATIVLTADRGEVGAGVSLDDASLHVPLLVKQPDGEGAGRRVAVPVQHIDILPTILDLVRAPIPSGLRGRSLRAVLDGDDAGLADRPIYAESLAEHFRFGGPGKFALASPEHRYVRSSREELTDLEGGHVVSPPPEASEAVRLRAELDRLLEGRPVNPPTEISAADEDRYAALGYLGGVPLVGSEPSAIEPDEEAWVVATHRAAAMLAGQKKYTAAIDRLRAIARAHPQMAVVQYQRGMLLSRTGRLEEAATAFRAAASVEPDNPYIPLELASVLLRARQYDDARDRAALAVALAERQDARARAAAHEIAARVALALGDSEHARAYAEAAERENPGVPTALFVRGRLLYAEGRYEEALMRFEEAAAVLREHGHALEELYWYLGDTLGRLDRYADAEMQFREELRAFPRSIRAYSSLATLYHASNRAGEVEEILDALIDAAPTPEGYAAAARLWMIVGEPSRATALTADARARFRGDPSLVLFQRRR
ncbi:MAG: sulfatase-like hydrolase/transferase [Acidobacteria bacterium]|nr:sulfatase-like hydrolase/transferase [Acidobacteriota bacterium]